VLWPLSQPGEEDEVAEWAPITPSQLLRFLDNRSLDLLRDYFGSGRFTGGRFERFGGGGDRPEIADRFTSDDVVAVSLLSVRLPGRASLALLDQRPAEFNALLGEIPTELDLWDADEAVIAPGSAAGRLWSLLDGLPGVGWVTAGKLLARKRPRLIPVYDKVVKAALERPDGGHWWRPLRAVLRDSPDVVTRLEELRAWSGIGPDISLLRVLDVAIWMRLHGQPEPAPEAEDLPIDQRVSFPEMGDNHRSESR
jgi:hypothetical protein